MWFPHGREFATLGVVITSPRTQAQGWSLAHGTGVRAVWRSESEPELGRCRLSSLSLAGLQEAVVHQWQGEVVSPPPPVPVLDGELRSLSAENVEEIAALLSAFGTSRQKLLALLSEGASICTLSRGRETVGYSMNRESDADM
ncbi:hypothetical protein ACVWYH_007819 [Bradyrhizobium sp. GM24.11]|jgi:hypothetical protein